MQNPRNNAYLGAGRPPGGLLGRIVAFIVGLGVLVVSLFLGFVFIAFVAGFVLLVGLFIAGRVWWLKRQMRAYEKEHGDINAEYTVIDVEVTETDRDPPDARRR
jgi:predicted lipid-binding transport protein (Tim44 family)